MSPEQYHQVLIGLDRALFVFHEAGAELDRRDRQLIARITALRADVFQLGSGHPFPLTTQFSAPDGAEITRAPWQ